MDRSGLIEALKIYDTNFAEEKLFVEQFLDLLKHPDAYQRHHLPGHITGSAWIIDHSRHYVLLTHHAKLNRWLQPGGHADGDENIFSVALKEAQEETGLPGYKLLLPTIFDIDIHTIPGRKDFPEHLHFDIRILLLGNKHENFIVSSESHALAWTPLGEVASKSGNNTSMMRMVEKTNPLSRR